MRIEEVIKQKEFENDYQKVVVNLIYTANWLRDRQVELLKPFAVLPQHFNVLRIIKGHHPEPISPGEITEVMMDKASDLTRLLDKIEKKGWIRRQTCPTNGRKIDVNLTEAGMVKLGEMSEAMEGFFHEIKDGFEEREASGLSDLLDKLRA